MANIIEVTGSQPLVTVDQDVNNVNVVNQPLEITVESAVAVGNATIRNALGAVPPIRYDKDSGVISFLDRSEVVRSEKMMDPVLIPIYAGGEDNSVVSLDAENFDIFTIQIAGEITGFEFGNITPGQTVTMICSQSTTPGQIAESSSNWTNWFWTNNNNHFPEDPNQAFMIKVLWTGNTYYASLIEFDTVMPDTQVGIPVGPDEPTSPEPGWLWYDTDNSLLMIYVDGDWVVAGGGGGASVFVGPEPGPTDPEVGDLWFNTSIDPATLQVYNNNQWNNSEGLQGPKGYTGSAGFDGSRGFQGFSGSQGNDGYTGSIGFTGSASTERGPVGSKGYTGSRGNTGPIGQTGYSGSRGFAGSTGLTGSKGDQGIQGYPGSKGDQGIQGYTGSGSTAPGFTGSKGDLGYTGSQGAGITIKDTVGTESELNPVYTGDVGDAYVTSDTGHLWIWDGDSWTDAGPFVGYTGSQGATGFTGSKGDVGLQGPHGYPGSHGYNGSQGFTGSKGDKGDDGSIGLEFEPPGDDRLYSRTYNPDDEEGAWRLNAIQGDAPDDGKQYARVRQSEQDTGGWELVQATGGGDWDGVLVDKPAVIQHPSDLDKSNTSDPNSGIVIGKNGFSQINPYNPLPILDASRNMVIGADSRILGNAGDPGTEDIILVGNGISRPSGTIPNNSMLLGNPTTKNIELSEWAIIQDSVVTRYATEYPVIRVAPTDTSDRSILLDSDHNLILSAGYHPDPSLAPNDKNLQFNATRVKHRLAFDKSINSPGGSSIQEIFPDFINYLSAGNRSHMPGDEILELGEDHTTWRTQRKLNYISPENIRLRKFTECVNRQAAGDGPGPYGNYFYSGPDLIIQLDYGTIHHSVMTQDITFLNILNVVNVEGPFGITRDTSAPEAGASITIILYHQDTIRTITWPDNFKFTGGDSALSTEVSGTPDHTINGTAVNNIKAIDMLHAFYDGYTWWASITRGYE